MSLSLLRLLPALIVLGTFASAVPATAQINVTGPASTSAPIIDESALRYFARQGDERRLGAEIARLSAIYPGWTPPTDPLSSETTVDPVIQKIWDLYGTGDLLGAQALIAERTKSAPDWLPPEDLASALASAQIKVQLRQAIASDDSIGVIELSATYPELLTCQNIDLLWGVGTAFAETNRAARALDAYRYMLTTCDNDRLATMQNAKELFDEGTLTELLTLQRLAADGQGEFAAIELDQARGHVADAINGVVSRVDPAALAMVEEAAERDQAPDDLRLLGYYDLDRNRTRQSRAWFEQAYAADNSTASIQGLATVLLRINDGLAAEDLLADIRDESPEIGALYLSAASAVLSGDPPRSLDADVLQRIVDMVTTTRNAQVAQDLGWYAYGLGQSQTAEQWFEESLAYDPSFEPAAYGLLVTSQKLRDTQKMRAIIQQWGPVSPRIRLFGQPGAPTAQPTRLLVRQPEMMMQNTVFRTDRKARPVFILMSDVTPSQRNALRECNDFVPPESLKPATALERGWCLLDIARDAEAEAAFRVATLSPSKSIRTDAYYGHTLALLRLELVDDAAVSASAMPQTAERVKIMQIALLSTSATVYYELGRYYDVLHLLDQRRALAPEENGLLTIRAWSYYHLNRLREAKQIFSAVAATGYQDAQRGLDALAALGF